jgi:hypothetical protein
MKRLFYDEGGGGAFWSFRPGSTEIVERELQVLDSKERPTSSDRFPNFSCCNVPWAGIIRKYGVRKLGQQNKLHLPLSNEPFRKICAQAKKNFIALHSRSPRANRGQAYAFTAIGARI